MWEEKQHGTVIRDPDIKIGSGLIFVEPPSAPAWVGELHHLEQQEWAFFRGHLSLTFTLVLAMVVIPTACVITWRHRIISRRNTHLRQIRKVADYAAYQVRLRKGFLPNTQEDVSLTAKLDQPFSKGNFAEEYIRQDSHRKSKTRASTASPPNRTHTAQPTRINAAPPKITNAAPPKVTSAVLPKQTNAALPKQMNVESELSKPTCDDDGICLSASKGATCEPDTLPRLDGLAKLLGETLAHVSLRIGVESEGIEADLNQDICRVEMETHMSEESESLDTSTLIFDTPDEVSSGKVTIRNAGTSHRGEGAVAGESVDSLPGECMAMEQREKNWRKFLRPRRYMDLETVDDSSHT